MKTTLNRRRNKVGGAILFTVVIVGIAAITMACYLALVKNEYTTVARSQTWNGSLVVAESGVEEALALINKYVQTTNSLTNWTGSVVSQDKWTAVSANVFSKTRTNGTYGYYTVFVTNINDGVNYTPAILSIGTAFWQGGDAGGGQISRKVLVQTSGDASASGGLTAQYVINFNGNNCVVDSYDSSDPTASYWHTNWFFNGKNFGTYTSALRTANVVVGTDGQLLQADAVSIYGYANTGPGGSVSIKSGGTIGDLGWIGPNPYSPYHSGIQPKHQRDDMNILFPDVILPAAAAAGASVHQPTNYTISINGILYTNNNNPYKANKASSYTIDGVSYSLFITNVTGNPGTSTNKIYYQYASQLNQSIYISASNVVLYLPNGVWLNNGDNVTVGMGANVDIYSGADLQFGNGLVNNLYQYADALRIYGLPNCQNITFGGNAALTINLYAPEASVNFNGGGSTTYDVCGQMKVANITVNGHYNFHFDEVLKIITPPTRYLPVLWQEVY